QEVKKREEKWTESIAVGSITFVNHFRQRFGHTIKGRDITGSGETVGLRESQSAYSAVFDTENASLRPENAYFWYVFDGISMG
ncbi:MAG: hypothetical protein JW786_01570, partial [Desulfobacterales bacterium]|nr:hypothetical protein [Desulfobacterales bacterium]